MARLALATNLPVTTSMALPTRLAASLTSALYKHCATISSVTFIKSSWMFRSAPSFHESNMRLAARVITAA